mmetsp:Transcript_14244/g.38200  ORF Transcript_14244/g.38200 Transcript_14244/m.38200 type:complete len:657 (+) Transcript_14244:69-2039(+)
MGARRANGLLRADAAIGGRHARRESGRRKEVQSREGRGERRARRERATRAESVSASSASNSSGSASSWSTSSTSSGSGSIEYTERVAADLQRESPYGIKRARRMKATRSERLGTDSVFKDEQRARKRAQREPCRSEAASSDSQQRSEAQAQGMSVEAQDRGNELPQPGRGDGITQSLGQAWIPDAENNPSTFVWRKRDAQLKKRNVAPARPEDLQKELEEATRQRAQRAAEREARLAEQAKRSREEEQKKHASWETREERFHAEQHYERQARRIENRRTRLVDTIALSVRVELHEMLQSNAAGPWEHLANSAQHELMQLLEDVADELRYVQLWEPILRDDDGAVISSLQSDDVRSDASHLLSRDERASFWRSIRFLAQALLAESEAKNEPGQKRNADEKAVEGALRDSVAAILKKSMRSPAGLEELRKLVDAIVSSEIAPNQDYWNFVAREIQIERAKQVVGKCHMCAASVCAELRKAAAAQSHQDAGSKSEAQNFAHTDELAFIAQERAKGLDAGEEEFNVEVREMQRSYAWSSLYAPRKPRYFNRAHIGYDWNKYNQTHYDKDNPPPKTVKGYKFNVYYPDLVDRTQTPTFRLEPADHPDACILRFVAGAPYEDLAFKIVKRPWEHSHKRGFRCSFDRGVLHLWFNFQRARYRR